MTVFSTNEEEWKYKVRADEPPIATVSGGRRVICGK